MVFSEQAYAREKKTLEKKLDAADKLLKKEHPLYHFNVQINPVVKYKKAGKPKVGDSPEVTGYKVDLALERNAEEIEKLLRRKGRFILATNDLDDVGFTNEQMLSEYKEQQKVESGFRFLKDPWFMVDSVFLKSARRIGALMMVMTLCLLVYNVGQYWLRKNLKDENKTLPNQLNKEVQNPTLRWIFQIMEGIGVAQIYEKGNATSLREVVTNLSDVRRRIIQLFGNSGLQMYGLTQKKALKGLGM